VHGPQIATADDRDLHVRSSVGGGVGQISPACRER
jgi:hypothetical protein